MKLANCTLHSQTALKDQFASFGVEIGDEIPTTKRLKEINEMDYKEFAKAEERLRNLSIKFIRMKGVGGKLSLSIAHQILAMSNEERKDLVEAITRGMEE